jgi:hypothetical protein
MVAIMSDPALAECDSLDSALLQVRIHNHLKEGKIVFDPYSGMFDGSLETDVELAQSDARRKAEI